MRDSSDYLVNTFFAAVRKKRTATACAGMASARWSLTMTARALAHDGLCSSGRNRQHRGHTRDIAIQEDRHELGDDITPLLRRSTSTAQKARQPATSPPHRKEPGQPRRGWHRPENGQARVDHETGKSMAESVERAIGWRAFTGSASSSSLASPPVRCA